MPRPSGPTTTEVGQRAEETACRYLVARGLRVLCRNYRSPCGEIDLVMEDGAGTVFVEVRLRRRGDFGSGAESVTAAKRKRLIATAQHYLQGHAAAARRPARFDVISLTAPGDVSDIDWLQNAFEA